MKKIISLSLILLVAVIVVGCSKQDNSPVKETKDLKSIELDKLKQALISNDFVEYEQNKFKLVYFEKYDENGKIITLKVDYFYVDTLYADEIFTNMNVTRTSMMNDYSFRTDIGKGSFIFFDENGEWENKYDYSYDFNSGNSSCKALTGTCNSQTYISTLKNKWLSFMTNNNIDIELLK